MIRLISRARVISGWATAIRRCCRGPGDNRTRFLPTRPPAAAARQHIVAMRGVDRADHRGGRGLHLFRPSRPQRRVVAAGAGSGIRGARQPDEFFLRMSRASAVAAAGLISAKTQSEHPVGSRPALCLFERCQTTARTLSGTSGLAVLWPQALPLAYCHTRALLLCRHITAGSCSS